MDDVSFWVALGGGLASFLTPCVLPMVPVYFASLVGPEILDPQSVVGHRLIFLHALSFVLGFAAAFSTLGTITGLAGVVINPNSPAVQGISGSLMILFGFFMLAAHRFSWLNYEKRLSPSLSKKTSYLRSFIIGAIFTLAWTPCVSPILGSILTLAWGSSETAWQGGYLLAVYSLGLGIPFLIIGAAFGSITPLIRRLNRYSTWVYNIGGILLIAVGLVILTGNMDWFIF
jgi:cytochrome c-type biogenesis protein